MDGFQQTSQVNLSGRININIHRIAGQFVNEKEHIVFSRKDTLFIFVHYFHFIQITIIGSVKEILISFYCKPF